jgi:chaperonin GroES
MASTSVATTFTPLHDRILVRRLEEGETIRGGIIIPDSAKEKPQEGEVIAVGKGKSNDEGKVFPLDVKAGDKVLFGKYSGTEIKTRRPGVPHHARRRSPRHRQEVAAHWCATVHSQSSQFEVESGQSIDNCELRN